MKNIIVCFVLLIPILIPAQSISENKTLNKPSLPEVCGVTFGGSYWFIEKELSKKYGEKSVYSDRNEIKYYDFHMGNYVFDSAKFCFEYDNDGVSYFNYATFSSNFGLDQYDKAKDLQKSLYITLVRKYGLVHSCIDDNGEVMYFCGDHPYSDRNLIILYLEKNKSVGGDWLYYVTLSYGPINFVDETEDF